MPVKIWPIIKLLVFVACVQIYYASPPTIGDPKEKRWGRSPISHKKHQCVPWNCVHLILYATLEHSSSIFTKLLYGHVGKLRKIMCHLLFRISHYSVQYLASNYPLSIISLTEDAWRLNNAHLLCGLFAKISPKILKWWIVPFSITCTAHA